MMSRLRGLGNIHILLASLMISGCASVQRAILDASLANTAAQENSEAPKGALDSGEPATTGAVTPRAGTGESDVPETTASVPAPPERVCDRSKAVAVGMTVAQVYKSCWGKPKSINTSVLGTTKTEMLLYEGYNYVYVENGIVKSIETSGR